MIPLTLFACSAPDAPDAPDMPAGSFTLTVTGGFGGGSYDEGAPIHVWADVDPQTEIATLSGDLDVLELPDEWNSPGVMPARDVTLVATTRAIDAPVEDRDIGERRVLVVAHPAPVGGVLFFHGAVYSVEELNDNAARTAVMHLNQAGWAVAALASTAETSAGTGGWSAVDLPHAEATIAALRADGTFPATGPVWAWGMSSGGQFAHEVGAASLVDGVVAFCAPGAADAIATTSAPTAWYLAAEDTVFASAIDDTLGYEADLQARGVRTDRYVHPATPLYDERFTRVAGIDAATSAAIAQGGVGSVPGLTPEQITAVNAELEIVAAEHELYDDVAVRMLRFLEER